MCFFSDLKILRQWESNTWKGNKNDNIKIDYPYVLKPINEGSSIGVQIIFSHGDYLELKDNSSIIMEKMIIEEYVPGIELQTADATSLSA